jgi:hypothetical protein
MTTDEKKALIGSYRKMIHDLSKTIASVSDAAAQYKGAVDHWSINEHIVHIMDFEIAGYSRYRRSIAESGMHIDLYDENKWKDALRYEIFDFRKCMKLLDLLIDLSTSHFEHIVEQDWSGYYIDHPEQGKVGLEKLIEFRVWHIGVHYEYILRNKKLYEETAGGK